MITPRFVILASLLSITVAGSTACRGKKAGVDGTGRAAFPTGDVAGESAMTADGTSRREMTEEERLTFSSSEQIPQTAETAFQEELPDDALQIPERPAVYFDLDSYDLKTDAIATLEQHRSWLA